MGEELGNFHIDFSMDNADTGIYAIESLFLGKKTYVGISESTDKDGKTINSEHIGMKGILTPCIKHYAQQHNIIVLDVYTKLFENKTTKFDLINDTTNFVRRSTEDYTISNVSDFARKC